MHKEQETNATRQETLSLDVQFSIMLIFSISLLFHKYICSVLEQEASWLKKAQLKKHSQYPKTVC